MRFDCRASAHLSTREGVYRVSDEEQIPMMLASWSPWADRDSVSPLDAIRAAMEAVRRGEDILTKPEPLLVSQRTLDRYHALLDKHGDTPEAISEATRIVLMQGAYRSPLEDIE
jgi:hypothetical protein